MGSNMNKVFVVQHVHKLDDEEDVKLIGVYRSAESVKAAAARLSLQSGFKDSPNGFSVDPYELDQDNWTEGFITV